MDCVPAASQTVTQHPDDTLSYLVVEAVAGPELCRVEGNLESRGDGVEAALHQVREHSELRGGSGAAGLRAAAKRQVAAETGKR